VTGAKKATDGLYVKDGLVPGSLHPMRELRRVQQRRRRRARFGKGFQRHGCSAGTLIAP
jgi:hypothetical protein